MLPVVLGDEGVDFSEAAGLVAMLNGPRLPFGHLVGPAFADHDLVFPRPDGTPTHPDAFSQTFDRAVVRLGLPVISLHDLRHTHATLLLRAGVPVKVVSERLGHANPAFTMTVYQHVIPGMQEEAASLFSDLIFGRESALAPAP